MHALEFEIGHTNLFFSDGEDEMGDNDNLGFSWHYDSFPFVCVTMLSDCTDMKGGETAILKGDGEIIKVRGPTMVSLPIASLYTGQLTVPGNCSHSPRSLH